MPIHFPRLTAISRVPVVAVLLVAASLADSGVAGAASFPCDKATTPIEKMICGNADLSVLDETMGRYYAGAREALGRGQACLVADQRSWLRGARNACKDAACLSRTYLQRLAVLDGLQPGVSRSRTLKLPRAPWLAWIIPPALDEAAAPRTKAGAPLVLQGRLIEEIESGDGFVLQTKAGKKHVVQSSMFFESPTTERLTALVRTPDAQYEVRGQSETGSDGVPHFAPGQCTFIYAIAP